MAAMRADGHNASRVWLRQQTSEARRKSLPAVVPSALGTLAAVGQAWCMGSVLGDLISAQAGQDVVGWLVLFGVLALVRTGVQVLADRAAFELGVAARRRLRSDVLSRVLQAGPALLRTFHSGDLVTAAMDRVEALDGLFGRWVPASSLAVGGPMLVGIAAFLADPVAGAVLAGAGLLVPFGMALAGLGAAAASRRQFEAMGRLQVRFLDRIRGIATIVLAGRTEDEADALATAAAELRRRTIRVLRVAFLSSAALDCAMAGALVVLAFRYGRLAAPSGPIRPQTAIFVLLLVPEFFAPLRTFAAAYQDRMHALSAAEALASLPRETPSAAAAAPIRTVAASGVRVGFDNVSLTWDPSRGPVLNELSFQVPPGETLVLAGPSGAGKSTVFEILLGFVRPDSGRVTINGADIATIVPQALSRMTAWIGQRPMLFHGSVRDNIRFGQPDASDAEIETAAHSARVLEFAHYLPSGLDTIIGEGGFGLSGGQAQRVAIARAFLKNAPLLLLDEPTAHLDPSTEGDVLDSVRRLALGRTVILASHSVAAHAFSGRRLDLQEGRAMPVRGVA